MKKLLLIGFACALALACSKDKYQNKPQISIKSINTSVVPIGGNLDIILSYTDKQGDLGDDTVFVRKIRVNNRVVATIRDTLFLHIPNFPNNPKGDIELNLDYQLDVISASNPPAIPGTNPVQYESDTLVLKIAVKDRGGNTSDTLTTGKIVVQRVQ
jgi:hypothetical protein